MKQPKITTVKATIRNVAKPIPKFHQRQYLKINLPRGGQRR